MGAAQCSYCGGLNVDYEGYCWTCEQQNVASGPLPPEWLVKPSDPFADLPPLPAVRSRARRIMTVVLPPIITFIIIACGFTGYYSFRLLDKVMTAPAAPVQPSGGVVVTPNPALVDGCVVGSWRVVSVTSTYLVDGVGKVYVTGKGGEIGLNADGSGAIDYSGMTESGGVNGATVFFAHSGKEMFRYKLNHGKIYFNELSGAINTIITINNNKNLDSYHGPRSGEMSLNCGGDSLRISDSSHTMVAYRIR